MASRIFWGSITAVAGVTALILVNHYTWTSGTTVVPAIGAFVLVHKNSPKLSYGPSMDYTTSEYESAISIALQSDRPQEIEVLIADESFTKPCISNGTILDPPHLIGSDQVPTGLYEDHRRDVYAQRIKVTDKLFAMTCGVTDAPGKDSYATRSIAFVAPGYKHQDLPDFRPPFPQFVNFEIAGNNDITILGADDTGRVPAILEERAISNPHQVVRARWTSIQSAGRKDFGLWFAAVIAGIAATTLIEFIRGFIPEAPARVNRANRKLPKRNR